MRWDEGDYQKISSVKKQRDNFIISFENGDVVSLPQEKLLPDSPHEVIGEIKLGPFDITLPTKTGDIEISWQTIRALSDDEFAAYLSSEAENEAHLIGQKIRELRRRKNMTSKELAMRANITPQSLSRIERGHHSISFKTLNKVLSAMNSDLSDLKSPDTSNVSINSLFKKLEQYGVSRDLVTERMFSKDLIERVEKEGDSSNKEKLISLLFKPLETIFGWTLEQLQNSQPLSFDAKILQTAKFKTPGRTQEKRAIAYAVYAHYVASLVVQAITIDLKELPEDPDEIRGKVIKQYGKLTLQTMLDFLWTMGIPVVALQDSGAFHGACWKINNRPVIVLKQLAGYHARWLYDLIHELGHVIRHLKKNNLVIEEEEISPFTDADLEEEANDFAGQLLLHGQGERLAEKCVELSKGKVEFLKSALPRVSSNEHVPTDILANYMAFRLSMQGINWWGTANNLQENDPLPWDMANKYLLKHVNLQKLTAEDGKILIQAINS